jgi:hypothetical protein
VRSIRARDADVNEVFRTPFVTFVRFTSCTFFLPDLPVTEQEDFGALAIFIFSAWPFGPFPRVITPLMLGGLARRTVGRAVFLSLSVNFEEFFFTAAVLTD